MNDYKVYMHIFPNNKKYIGITRQELNKRWKNGLGYETQKLIYKAIKKYGWENIRHEVLFEKLSKELANKKEIELIVLYKTHNSKYGYNIESGGVCSKSFSNITKNKLKQARKKPNQCNRKPIYCISTNETFTSIKDAAVKYNLFESNIIKVCKGICMKTGGLVFCYSKDKNAYKIRKYNTNSKKIRCVETNEVFESSQEASDKYKILIWNIYYALHNKPTKRKGFRTAGGYRWIYEL